MNRFFDPSLLARTYRDPMACLLLFVDLLPVLAVIFFGWGAAPLVALYWLENLIIGGVTIARMLATMSQAAAGLAAGLFLIPFFCFHYGMFCFVHGIFLFVFAQIGDGGAGFGFPDPAFLISWALGSGVGMGWFVLAIIAVNTLFFMSDFILTGDYRSADLSKEMGAPYGRIVTLHVAIIFGAGITLGLGQPLLGVFLLILLRVLFGMILAMRRRLRLDEENPAPILNFSGRS